MFSFKNARWLLALGAAFVSFWLVQVLSAAPDRVPPPSTIRVMMYQLNENGSIFAPGGTPHACATPANRTEWGCTAFHEGSTPVVTLVPYPYGNTPAPQVSFETDYLKNVVPQEMAGGSPQTALRAQAVAARSYAMYQTGIGGEFNNSASRQVFVPYRFELLRVEGGDPGHNPTTTPTPNVNNCTTIPDSGVTRYQRNVCEALSHTRGVYVSPSDRDAPVMTEFSSDVKARTTPGATPHLVSVDNPISTACDAQNVGHGRGMSQKGAMRWARGHECSYDNATPASGNRPGAPWSVRWENYRQILVHYYTGIHLRNASGSPLTPADRWNLLKHNVPASMPASTNRSVTLILQNTSTWDWWSGSVALGYQWTSRGAPPDDGNWQIASQSLSLAQGQTLTNTVSIVAPGSGGLYDLHWDLANTGPQIARRAAVSGSWFHWNWPHPIIPVTITGASPTPTPSPSPPPTPTPTPGPGWVAVEQVVLQEASLRERENYSRLLSRARDQVMLRRQGGQLYVDLTYRYAPELTTILLRNPSLRQRAQALMLQVQPGGEAFAGDNPASTWTASQELVNQADALLKDLSAEASPALAAEIGWWRKRLPGWVGKSPQQMWDELLKEPRGLLVTPASR